MIVKPNLTEKELQKNYEEFTTFVEKSFTGERKEKLLKLYAEDELGSEACISPASVCEHFHLAYPGGYLIHVMNVIKLSAAQSKLFEMAGCKIDYTDEERIFAAMHHDLGKLGMPASEGEGGPYYVPQDEDWKSRKGEVYKLNPNIQYMEVTDRALFILQKFGISMSWREYLGIKLADGLFNEAAVKYFKQFNQDMYLRTNLPRVIHAADYLACRCEFDSWKYSDPKTDMDS
jgi:hypothetical protein